MWGLGNTAKEAMEDLNELIETQIEFAVGKRELAILNHPTEKRWFDLWDTLQKFEEEQTRTRESSTLMEARTSTTFILNSSEKGQFYNQAA